MLNDDFHGGEETDIYMEINDHTVEDVLLFQVEKELLRDSKDVLPCRVEKEVSRDKKDVLPCQVEKYIPFDNEDVLPCQVEKDVPLDNEVDDVQFPKQFKGATIRTYHSNIFSDVSDLYKGYLFLNR